MTIFELKQKSDDVGTFSADFANCFSYQFFLSLYLIKTTKDRAAQTQTLGGIFATLKS